MATIKANILFQDDVLPIILPTKESCYFQHIAQNAKKRKYVYVNAKKKETSAQVVVPQTKSCNQLEWEFPRMKAMPLFASIYIICSIEIINILQKCFEIV